MNTPMRPDREPPDPADVARIEATEDLDLDEEIDEGEDADVDDDLKGLDKTLADSFPASDPPQAP
jgi:hypothetical protein